MASTEAEDWAFHGWTDFFFLSVQKQFRSVTFCFLIFPLFLHSAVPFRAQHSLPSASMYISTVFLIFIIVVVSVLAVESMFTRVGGTTVYAGLLATTFNRRVYGISVHLRNKLMLQKTRLFGCCRNLLAHKTTSWKHTPRLQNT